MMKILLFVILAIGLALSVISFVLASSVAKCSVHAQNAVRGLLTMGVALFSISATMLFCSCGTGAQINSSDSKFTIVFPSVLIFIGCVTLGLISTIHNQCEDARKTTTTLIVLGVLVIAGLIGLLAMNIKNRFKPGLISSGASPSASSANSPTSSDYSPLYGG